MAVTQRDLKRLLDPIRLRLRLLFSRAVVVAVRDGEGFQILQLKGLPGEVLDGVERFQNYGFTSVPLVGAEAIVGFVGGSRSHGVGVAVDDRRHRKKGLAPGESAQYSDEGDFVHLKRGKKIEIHSGGEVAVDAPTVRLSGATEVILEGGTIKLDGTGTVEIGGAAVTITGVTTIEGKVFLAHTHSGVQSGGSNTGGVV